jgi:type I site-specific restriction endonuclease
MVQLLLHRMEPFSTGINIKNLHNLVLGSPTKSRIRSLQSIGRGLRIGDSTDILLDNEKVTIYDIVDNLQYKKKANFTLKHFMERVKIYNSEKFPYKVYNIDLKE